jgi:hypothetical protein
MHAVFAHIVLKSSLVCTANVNTAVAATAAVYYHYA